MEDESVRYAGFGRRFLAGLVDALVWLPLVGVYLLTLGTSRTLTLLFVIPYSLFGAWYVIYFHGRFGKTIGKMALRIRVVRVGGSAIGFREAFLRHLPDAILGLLGAVALFLGLEQIPDAMFASASGLLARMKLVAGAKPGWAGAADALAQAWWWSEVVVMLTNAKRRALHDFLAGTVVVRDADG